jgi:ribosomal protein L7/L12
MKKKPKAAAGDRSDVILTDGGDQKIEVARVVKEITRRHRVAAELTELFDCPTPIVEGITEDQAEQIKRRIEKAPLHAH